MNRDSCDYSKLELARQENQQVMFLLESMGLVRTLRSEMIQWQRERYGEGLLTFAAFNEVVPDFPIHLGYMQRFKLDRNTNCTLAAILTKPEKSWFYTSWKILYDSLHLADMPGSRPVGVVFPYGNFPGGLVIYNGFFQPSATVIRKRIIQFETSRQTFTIQRYLHLLAAIKDSEWVQGDLPKQHEERLSLSGLLRQVTGAPQKLVLALLVDILNGDVEKWPDWAARAELIRRYDGTRWITLTHQEIGDALGLEVHQVRRALRSLRASGMIAQGCHKGTYAYSVNG